MRGRSVNLATDFMILIITINEWNKSDIGDDNNIGGIWWIQNRTRILHIRICGNYLWVCCCWNDLPSKVQRLIDCCCGEKSPEWTYLIFLDRFCWRLKDDKHCVLVLYVVSRLFLQHPVKYSDYKQVLMMVFITSSDDFSSFQLSLWNIDRRIRNKLANHRRRCVATTATQKNASASFPGTSEIASENQVFELHLRITFKTKTHYVLVAHNMLNISDAIILE